MVESISCDSEIYEQKLSSVVTCSHAKSYSPLYIWSPRPAIKGTILDMSSSFDIPTTVLFVLSLSMAIALVKLYTKLGSQLSLELESEELVMVPTR